MKKTIRILAAIAALCATFATLSSVSVAATSVEPLRFDEKAEQALEIAFRGYFKEVAPRTRRVSHENEFFVFNEHAKLVERYHDGDWDLPVEIVITPVVNESNNEDGVEDSTTDNNVGEPEHNPMPVFDPCGRIDPCGDTDSTDLSGDTDSTNLCCDEEEYVTVVPVAVSTEPENNPAPEVFDPCAKLQEPVDINYRCFEAYNFVLKRWFTAYNVSPHHAAKEGNFEF